MNHDKSNIMPIICGRLGSHWWMMSGSWNLFTIGDPKQPQKQSRPKGPNNLWTSAPPLVLRLVCLLCSLNTCRFFPVGVYWWAHMPNRPLMKKPWHKDYITKCIVLFVLNTRRQLVQNVYSQTKKSWWEKDADVTRCWEVLAMWRQIATNVFSPCGCMLWTNKGRMEQCCNNNNKSQAGTRRSGNSNTTT